jgi:hypothetical protein
MCTIGAIGAFTTEMLMAGSGVITPATVTGENGAALSN